MGLKGSCLCGEIGYEIDSVDMLIVHCHCQTCRKAHAASFASTVGVKREHFHWLTGSGSISTFESLPGKLRHFCKHRGLHRTPLIIGVSLKVLHGH
ncbi:GFA family protein [Marinobacter sp. F3R08]|uniref:GFA family protein n=1 Tax=Marinobacter sp. F3R08 TaxID=2841559 RepID=UPI001C0A5151|nr:GFA family protein [Marinobacter sp. F3R08]MBU2952715.1 GFA family protein [Marinobacter sp. F3R08]